ncbi:MAG: 16S rRNA (guanine(527)-N(7))-methyltransferase RsmG [Minicystis sp.]
MSPAHRESIPLPDTTPLSPPGDWAERLAALGVSLDAAATTKLGDYLARLLAMNERMNLTAITDPIEVWTRHGLDALSLVPLLAELGPRASLVDVGSGGGVPGIPIAVARPDLRVTLVEATQKKAAFLDAVAKALGLANVSVRAERAEQLARGPLREAFDVATARAVGKIAQLGPLMVPFVKPGGRVLLIKGQRAGEELAEATTVLGRLRCTAENTVDTPTGRIVVLRVGARR